MWVALLVVGALAPVAAQERAAFRIAAIEYEITGRTRQFTIEEIVSVEVGDEFATEDELLAALAVEAQQLLNRRFLQDAAVSFRPANAEAAAESADADTDAAGEPVPVVVTVATRDSWNIIVLPYGRYDSNSGLLLSLRGRDYNFFGTGEELSIDLDYEFTEDNEDFYTIAVEFSLPFRLLEQRWRLDAEQTVTFQLDNVESESELGLAYGFDWMGVEWEALFSQRFSYLSADELGDVSFWTSRAALATSLNTGVVAGPFGELAYQPELFTEVSYRPGGISEDRRGVIAGLDQALVAGGFDWIGNYRRGQRVRLENNNAYNIERNRWDSEITARASIWRDVWQPRADDWPKAGVSASLSGFYLIDGADTTANSTTAQDDAAADIRGVLDDTVNGDLGIFLNLDAVITVWTWRPVAEGQFGVFFDAGIVRDLRGDFYASRAFDAERDVQFGSGIEVIGFPLFARALYIRGSLGFDVRKVADGANPLSSEAREIFIGLGHHY